MVKNRLINSFGSEFPIKIMLEYSIITFNIIEAFHLHCHQSFRSFRYLEEAADLVTFTKEILNGKLHFLCIVWSACQSDAYSQPWKTFMILAVNYNRKKVSIIEVWPSLKYALTTHTRYFGICFLENLPSHDTVYP